MMDRRVSIKVEMRFGWLAAIQSAAFSPFSSIMHLMRTGGNWSGLDTGLRLALNLLRRPPRIHTGDPHGFRDQR